MCYPLVKSINPIVSISSVNFAAHGDRSFGRDLYRCGVARHTISQHEQHPISRQSNAFIFGNYHGVPPVRSITFLDDSQLDASQIVVQGVSRRAVSYKTGSVHFNICRDNDLVANLVHVLVVGGGVRIFGCATAVLPSGVNR